MVRQSSAVVKLHVYSWIAGTLGKVEIQNQMLKRKLLPGMTLHDLFAELAASFPQFRDQVYNPDTRKFNDQVMVILNNRLIQSHEFSSTPLNENDTVTLSPVLVGG